ncbi:MAG: hypothetical protein ACKO4W_03805, partial [Bacteroidota bacterium]
MQGIGTPVIRYEFPDQIGGNSANNVLQINPVTGDILWASPREAGEYNIAFIVVSWRGGEPIDTTIRDM